MTRIAVFFSTGLLLAGCDGGPSTGTCAGAIGGVKVDGTIDAEDTRFHVRHPNAPGNTTGATLVVVGLGYAKGALRVTAVTDDPFLKQGTFTLPPLAGADFVREWTVSAPATRPAMKEGTLTLDQGFTLLRLKGSFVMGHEDGTRATCAFEVRRERSEDEGTPPPSSDWDDD